MIVCQEKTDTWIMVLVLGICLQRYGDEIVSNDVVLLLPPHHAKWMRAEMEGLNIIYLMRSYCWCSEIDNRCVRIEQPRLSHLACAVDDKCFMPWIILPFQQLLVSFSFHCLHFYARTLVYSLHFYAWTFAFLLHFYAWILLAKLIKIFNIWNNSLWYLREFNRDLWYYNSTRVTNSMWHCYEIVRFCDEWNYR